MVKKIIIYSAIFFIASLLLTPDELFCSFKLNEICIAAIVVKWIFFVLIMFVYDKIIKPLFQKKTK